MELEYEPEFSTIYMNAHDAVLNPIYRYNPNGFVLVRPSAQVPATITLEADLPLISTDIYGPLPAGNSFAPIVAIVRDAHGNVIEDQEVVFELTDSLLVGSFGTDDADTSSITDDDGEATVFYNGPQSIDELGEIT